MKKLEFDYSSALKFLHEGEISNLTEDIALCHQKLHDKSGQGSEYLGWVDLPVQYDQAEFARIKQTAAKIRSDSDVLIVVGIGGSYLGARSAIELLSHSFYNMVARKQSGLQIFFAGHNVSGNYLKELLELIEGLDISVNVISKSGTTTEPALVFRVLQEHMEQKYGKAASERIYVTTDKQEGALKQLADQKGYQTFIIPEDIGGRYSVLTPVGLLPIAAAGIDIDAMMAGAAAARLWYQEPDLLKNEAYQYAAIRNILSRKGKVIEILVNYDPKLHYFAEWWKQLFGESEGKDLKGIFPTAVDFSTDLHSLGQYIQQGMRNLFETVLYVETPQSDLVVQEAQDNLDGLNYTTGYSFAQINKQAFLGTLLAHVDGGVPNLVVTIPEISAYYYGALVYFFEKACGISGYLLGVNPFDQPGVEAYKQNMFALLGKPGYQQQQKQLRARLTR